jgi:hypothetical protein
MRLLAAAFLLLLTSLPQQQPNPNINPKDASIEKGDAQREAGNEEREPAKITPQITIQKCDSCLVSVEAPNANYKQGDAYDPRHDALYRTYLRFTIIGVVAALGGIVAIYRQTVATKDAAEATRESAEATARSAKATERSVKLEEDTHRPWVDLRDWSVFRIQPTHTIEIEFSVANPTRLPLELHGVLVTIDGSELMKMLPLC